MKKVILSAAAAAMAFIACEKSNVESEHVSSDTVTLTVNVPSVSTKAAGNASEESETAVKSYQIFVFSGTERRLETYLETSAPENEIVCTTGDKDIVVIANAPDLSGASSFENLKKMKSKLSENTLGSLLMEGHSAVNIASNSAVTVNLKRNVAKVRLTKVEMAFDMGAYQSSSLKINAIYLIRVAGEKTYLSDAAPTLWLNRQVYEKNSQYDALLYESVTGVQVANGSSYASPHYFYCYPNPNSADSAPDTATRLVVEAVLDGVTCYYPVDLPAIRKNVVYDVALKITRPGADLPSDDVEQYASDFTVNVLDWDETVPVNETI